MNKSSIRLIICALSLFIIKFIFNKIHISNMILYLMSEIFSLFIVAFCIIFAVGFKKNNEEIIYKQSLIISIGFVIFSLPIIYLKEVFSPLFLNYILLIGILILPSISLYLQDSIYNKRILIRVIFSIIFVLIISQLTKFLPENNFNILRILLFSLLPFYIRIMYTIVDYFFVKGYVEYDDFEYPLFATLRAGSSKTADIQIDEKIGGKSLLFSLNYRKKEAVIRPVTPLEIDRVSTMEKTILKDGDTLKAEKHYFSYYKGRGNLFRKAFFLFFYVFLLDVCLFADQQNFVFTDISEYPMIKSYTPVFSDKNSYPYFISIDSLPIDSEVVVDSSFAIDIYLILDVTGNMVEQYALFKKHSDTLFKTMQKNGKKCRFFITGFADEKNDCIDYKSALNPHEFTNKISSITSRQGNDFKENPLDAIFSRDISSSLNTLKVFILFTDAPPHERGSKGKDGVLDFTNKTVLDVLEYIREQNILIYVASYERYTEYQPFYGKDINRFYDIETVNDFGNVLVAIIRELSSMHSFSFSSNAKPSTVRDNTIILYGDEAKPGKLENSIKRIKKKQFLHFFF